MKLDNYRQNYTPTPEPVTRPTMDDILAGAGFVLCVVLLILL